MTAETRIAATGLDPLAEEPHARVPHLVFRDVLGTAWVRGLLGYVAAREADFRPAIVRDRRSGKQRVDKARRDCLALSDLGTARDHFESFVRAAAPRILAELHLAETAVEPQEFAICAYGNGGRFAGHIDTNEVTDRVRVVSCVYYFAATPRRFSGGELRLYGLPTLSGGRASDAPFIDITPETDALVVFPSWLRHEVLLVRMPEGSWRDHRFTINCWLHRTHSGAAASAVR
jgi:SM-20-related protein